MAAAGGCQKDTRITVDDLARLETELAASSTEAVPTTMPATQPVDYQPSYMRRYHVVPGDVLIVTLYGMEDSPYTATVLELRVQDDGALHMPVVGAIDVDGADLAAIERAIVQAHVPKVVRDLTAYVQVKRPEQTTVFVQGSVPRPGIVRLDENERTPLHALAQAGGFAPDSSGRLLVAPITTGADARVYDFKHIDGVRTALQGHRLESGDVITVEASEPRLIYVTGVLNQPTPVPLPRDRTISVMRVVAAAGGLVDFLEPEEATLWRRLTDGRQVRVKLNLDDIRSGRGQDIALQAGDILDVPHTLGSRFRQWVAENVKIGPFGVTAVYDPVADYRARILADDNNNSVSGQFLDILGTGLSNAIVPVVP
jgi:protein involved in polysaccharide export with SLBB domain